jgi:hypothetical protein
MRGNLVQDICAFAPSKAGLTKEVVFHKGGLSEEVLLYIHHIQDAQVIHDVH